MKLSKDGLMMVTMSVASHAEAWIETTYPAVINWRTPVASHAEAWIETV